MRTVGLLTSVALVATSFLGLGGRTLAGEAPKVYPVAILPFQERGSGVKGYGEKVSDLLFAALARSPAIYLVDRADIKKLLDEHELNLSGMVAPGQATQVGQLTGAQILVTGSVIEVDKSIYIVGKIIGTETSRVLGASVKGRTRDEVGPLVEELAATVGDTVTKQATKLVAEEVKPADQLAALNEKLGLARRPAVLIRITERHVGQATVDPAAQTELALCCKAAGFEVIDPDEGRKADADVVITGQGFSEFAMRRGSLVSVKARLELKATDPRSGKVLAAGRQVTVQVDLTEQIAGKNALQQAALGIALRLLPKVVEAWNKLPAPKK